MRSSNGPDKRCRYLRIATCVQVQLRPRPLKRPHGQGFAARTNINLAGYVTEPTALEIVTFPDSSG